MDARPLGLAATRPGSSSPPMAKLPLCLACVATALLIGVTTVIAGRRIAGSLQQPLDEVSLVMAALVLAVTMSLLRVVWARAHSTGLTTDKRRVISAILLGTIFVLACSLTLPGSSPWGASLFWSILVVEECVHWLTGLRSSNRVQSSTVEIEDPANNSQDASNNETTTRFTMANTLAEQLPDELDDEMSLDRVTQQLTRMSDDDGCEQIHGILREHFAARERTKCLHVAFCPPLSVAPQLTIEQIEGPPATVKAAQVESFGARIDLRLKSTLDDPAIVVVEFVAQVAATSEAA